MNLRACLTWLLLVALALPARAEERVTLRFSWWGGNEVHRAFLDSAREFERRHPNIRVRTEYTGWVGHLERLTTQIAGDTAPDLMQINWYWQLLFSRDGQGFADLRALGEQLDLSQFDEESLAMGTVRGRLNAVPVSMAARMFFFNRTTFDKAGIPVPRTWDELFAAGPIFRDRLGPDYYPLQLNMQDVMALSRAWIAQDTGQPFVDEAGKRLIPDARQLIDAARFYQRLVDAHVIASARERASYGYLANQELRPWTTGHYAGVYEWVSSISKFAATLAPGQTLELAPHPVKPGARDAGILYRPAMMLAINAHSEHPREAAMLLDFLLNDPWAARRMGLRHGVPVSRAAYETLRADGALQGLEAQGAAQARELAPGFRESGFFEHPRVRDAFIDVIELLAYGRIDAEEAGKRLHDDLNRILERTIR